MITEKQFRKKDGDRMSAITKSIESYSIESNLVDHYGNAREDVITSVKVKINAGVGQESVFTYFVINLDTSNLSNFTDLDQMSDDNILQMCETYLTGQLRREYGIVRNCLLQVLNYNIRNPQ